MRMNAYYFCFTPTGCEEIDKILSAVAEAGKAYHNTEYWVDPDETGFSYADRIQAAAVNAADKLRPR